MRTTHILPFAASHPIYTCTCIIYAFIYVYYVSQLLHVHVLYDSYYRYIHVCVHVLYDLYLFLGLSHGLHEERDNLLVIIVNGLLQSRPRGLHTHTHTHTQKKRKELSHNVHVHVVLNVHARDLHVCVLN